MLRSLLLSAILGVFTLLLYARISSPSHFSTEMASTSWSSPFAAWHARALETPHPNPHDFTPTLSSLLLAVLRNDPVETEGITLALFSSKASDTQKIVAVDAVGRVLLVSSNDADGILALAQQTRDLPDTGAWRNTWIIVHDRTSQPIDRIFVAPKAPKTSPSLDDLKQVSVQGFSKTQRALVKPVEGRTELPDSLWELAGLVLEAREDAVLGGRRDEVVLDKIRSIVRPLF